MTSTRKLPEDAFTVRLIQEGDLSAAVEMIKNENWYIWEKSKMDLIYREQVVTFYVIVDNSDAGQVLGLANVSKTREDEAVLGNVIIHKEHRGKGLGTILLKKVLELHNDINLTWFSAADQFYMSLGCKICEQQGFVVQMTVDREKLTRYCRENHLESEDDVVLFTDDRKEELIHYDTKARGYANPNFLHFLMKIADNITMAVRTSGTDRTVRGYVANCCEPTGVLFFSGLYADDNKTAAHLLRSAMDAFPKVEEVRFYTLVNCQFLTQFGTPSMAVTESRVSCKGAPAKIPEEKVYCLSEPGISY